MLDTDALWSDDDDEPKRTKHNFDNTVIFTPQCWTDISGADVQHPCHKQKSPQDQNRQTTGVAS